MRSLWYAGLTAVMALALAAGCRASKTDVGGTPAPGDAGTVAKLPEGVAFDPDKARLEDAIYEFQCAYVSARPFFELKEGERYQYRMCEAVAVDLDYFAGLVVEKHIKEFMPAGPAFHRDIKFVARHAHDLSVACAGHRPEEIRKSWERMVVLVERALPPKVSLDGTVARPVVFGERCRGVELDPFGEAMIEEAGKGGRGGGKAGDASKPEGKGKPAGEEEKKESEKSAP